MRAEELKNKLYGLFGQSDEDPYGEYWTEYTGLNGFFHLLSNETGYGTDNELANNELISEIPNGLRVEGLGDFKKVEVFEHDFDTYEQFAYTTLVFEFDGEYFAITARLDSHAGGVWDDRQFRKVKSVQKTIDVWENV